MCTTKPEIELKVILWTNCKIKYAEDNIKLFCQKSNWVKTFFFNVVTNNRIREKLRSNQIEKSVLVGRWTKPKGQHIYFIVILFVPKVTFLYFWCRLIWIKYTVSHWSIRKTKIRNNSPEFSSRISNYVRTSWQFLQFTQTYQT